MPKQLSNVASDDYLTTIYRLHVDEGFDVIAVRLADRLEITPPSVAGMLKRLQRDGLVQVDDVGPVDQLQVLCPLARQLLVRPLESANEG